MAQELVAHYPQAYLADKIRLLEWKLATPRRARPIVDTAAWLVRAIEADYRLPTAVATRPAKPRMKVLTFNEQEGVYIVVEEPPDTLPTSSSP